MKKLLLGAAVLLGAASLKAQPLSNHLYVSGGISFQSSDYEETAVGVGSVSNESSQFEFSPAIGYTFADNWLAGARLNIVSQSNNGASDSDLGIQLFGRYYIEATDRFYFFPELLIGFASDDIYQNTGIPGEPSQFQFGIRPGFAYYPTTHWGIELYAGFVGFTSSKLTDETVTPNIEYKQTNTAFVFDMASVGVGVSYLFML